MATDAPGDEYLRPKPPERGDRLFVQDRENWPMDAMLDSQHGDSFAYREGYRMAGQILTQHAERGWVDFLVYPICHSYRHYIELTLKHLMRYGCRLAERELTPEELKLNTESHDLMRLWTRFKLMEREVAAVTGESYPPKEMDGISAYIEQLHAIDKGSFSFRYPQTKAGSVSVPLERINLTRFGEAMERLCTALGSIDSYYGHMISATEDMYSGESAY